jgi:hypothetical protein
VQPPFEEKAMSHGLCDDCFPAEMERIKKALEAFHGEERVVSFAYSESSISRNY